MEVHYFKLMSPTELQRSQKYRECRDITRDTCKNNIIKVFSTRLAFYTSSYKLQEPKNTLNNSDMNKFFILENICLPLGR